MPTREELTASMGEKDPHTNAAVLLPLVAGSRGWELLFEVRSADVPQPGEICFPGGHIEEGETPVDAALRESWEEIALPPEAVELIAALTPDKKRGARWVQPIIGRVAADALSALSPNREEVAEVFTVPIDWLRETPALACDTDGDDPIPPVLEAFLARYPRPIRTLCWEYEGHVIWGLTARLTNVLLEQWEQLGL